MSFGEVFPFTLEHNEIRCVVSGKHLFDPKARPGEEEHGVLTDIPTTSIQISDCRGEIESVLAFTVKHIRQARNEL